MLPIKVVVKQGVESFIFKGADLMWPGIQEISHVLQSEDELRFK